ncbi:MAG: peptide-methionine (S)-S-oxide reductase MsrA [Nitrosomonadales bacterium]|nr:peptide-methionine (S)-S-oxide reductase MsrA [Nitrosomonadales bacterium]
MHRLLVLILTGLLTAPAFADGQLARLPDPVVDAPLAARSTQQTAVFAGGCFWGVELVFQHVKGVVSATSGYAGGTADSARYDAVSGGSTGHAESVQVVFDPSKVSYGRLLKIFFAVAHDPTQLDRQGPDTGPQYRSAIFTTDDGQQRIARAYISQLDAARVYPKKIVTRVDALPVFYPAEDYHQDFATLHPHNPYIYVHDRPKLERLKQQFPAWYK